MHDANPKNFTPIKVERFIKTSRFYGHLTCSKLSFCWKVSVKKSFNGICKEFFTDNANATVDTIIILLIVKFVKFDKIAIASSSRADLEMSVCGKLTSCI